MLYHEVRGRSGFGGILFCPCDDPYLPMNTCWYVTSSSAWLLYIHEFFDDNSSDKVSNSGTVVGKVKPIPGFCSIPASEWHKIFTK